MRGFYISVKNDLLEPKHFEQMGNSVWLYLWLLDKMTSINESGEGKVLGGKPIKYNDLGMGFSQRTYGRQIKQLQKFKYIKVLRTPYGYVFTVYKAKKYFGNDEIRQKGKSIEIRQVGGNKEDNTADNTITYRDKLDGVKNNNTKPMSGFNKNSEDAFEETVVDLDTGEVSNAKPNRKKKTTPEMVEVFNLFDTPARKLWSMYPKEREAAQVLYEAYGIEKLKVRMERIKKEAKRGDPMFPLIVTPSQLLDKMPNIERYFNI